VIVRLALQVEMHPGKRECAETLTALPRNRSRSGSPGPAPPCGPRQLTRDARADREMMIADRPNP